jgi:thiol-disulfide isomerase/thioredoxin
MVPRFFAALLSMVIATVVFVPRSSRAGENLNVQDWLGQPGVRLVAVEFYATWCEPCMKAMPRWKALKEKYAAQGLRVVVVNTQDPDGGCRALPFVPDETVCDLSGSVADGFRLQGKLPSAFLWSWQGNLLVAKGHIDEIEKAVETYFQTAPRVLVEAAVDLPNGLKAAVAERLTEAGKVVVLASEEERAAIELAKRTQQGARYDEKLTCEIGKEVPPNALLKVNRVQQRGAGAFLNVGLYDLKSGCLLASASTEWYADFRRMTQDAVSKLERKLKRSDGYEKPTGASSSVADADPSRGAAAKERNASEKVYPMRTAGWWTLGAGAALMAGGGAMAFVANAQGDDVRSAYDACVRDAAASCASKASIDSAVRANTFANLGLYGGAALALLGTYWLFDEPSKDRINVRLGFSSVSFGGSF